MNKELKKSIQIPQAIMQEAYPQERTKFRALLLTNPNYFGNLLDSKFKPVLPIFGNTYYEELACVGYHPQQERLEAIVYINQPSGYGTDICGAGTPEYVRFYLSYDSGVTWEDQGMISFQAYDILEGTEGNKRLEYAVSFEIHPKKKPCQFDPLIRVRAILSWNNPPSANQPNWKPVWGNVHEAEILVEPRRLIFLPEILKLSEIDVHPLLKETIDTDMPIQTKTKVFSVAELAEKYKGKDVPVHRFAFKEISAAVSAKTSISSESFATLLPGIKIDPEIIDLLFPKTDGDISYEELKCIGLDPNSPNTLVGVIHVKKLLGYSGEPCTGGSLEYITFWADFDGNGSFETCLGTADVRVYDLANMPPTGVYYAVRLPVDLSSFSQPCKKGPRLIRIRAILSWNAIAPCFNPNYVPTWGNRVETLINVMPSASAGKIAILGGIPVAYINDVTGLTTPDAIFATNNLPPDNPDGILTTPDGRPCPFAGMVTVQGAPLKGYSYKVEVMPAGGGAPTAVVNDLVLARQDGTTHVHKADPVTLRFNYLDIKNNVNSLLAKWYTAGDGLWAVKLTTFNGVASNALAPIESVDIHLIQLDNTGPEASINIKTGTGNCGRFSIGTTLSGNFVARDNYLGSYNISIEPALNMPPVGVPNPGSGLVNTAMAPGNIWELKTDGMKPCGYVIRVVVVDRAIVNSQSVGHWNSNSAGFCLTKQKEE
jgi:hypothetical protein